MMMTCKKERTRARNRSAIIVVLELYILLMPMYVFTDHLRNTIKTCISNSGIIKNIRIELNTIQYNTLHYGIIKSSTAQYDTEQRNKIWKRKSSRLEPNSLKSNRIGQKDA